MWSHGPFNSIRISTTQSLVRCGSQRAGQNYARPESTSASRDYVGETLDLTELSEHLFLLVTSRAKESSKGARIGGRKIRGDWPRTQIGLSSWSSVTNIMTPVWLGRLYRLTFSLRDSIARPESPALCCFLWWSMIRWIIVFFLRWKMHLWRACSLARINEDSICTPEFRYTWLHALPTACLLRCRFNSIHNIRLKLTRENHQVWSTVSTDLEMLFRN